MCVGPQEQKVASCCLQDSTDISEIQELVIWPAPCIEGVLAANLVSNPGCQVRLQVHSCVSSCPSVVAAVKTLSVDVRKKLHSTDGHGPLLSQSWSLQEESVLLHMYCRFDNKPVAKLQNVTAVCSSSSSASMAPLLLFSCEPTSLATLKFYD